SSLECLSHRSDYSSRNLPISAPALLQNLKQSLLFGAPIRAHPSPLRSCSCRPFAFPLALAFADKQVGYPSRTLETNVADWLKERLILKGEFSDRILLEV